MRMLLLSIVALLPSLLYGWILIPFAEKVRVREEAGGSWFREANKFLIWPMVLVVVWCAGMGLFFMDRSFIFKMPMPENLALLEDALVVWASVVASLIAMSITLFSRIFIERVWRARPSHA